MQLDSIATVDRAHRLTLGARDRRVSEAELSRLLREGRVFEYWSHEACLLAIEDYVLFKWRMADLRDRHWWGRERSAELRPVEEQVLARIRDEGALPARAFEGRSGPMWGWKPAKRALEHLFAAGEIAVAGRQGFQRLYELPERVIPRAALEAPAPSSDEFHRGSRSARSRAAARSPRPGSPSTAASAAARRRCGRTSTRSSGTAPSARVEVEDGGPPVVVPAAAELDGDPAAAVLLCPFDNLVWDRAFLRRLFGFDHVIEVYKREPERVYGYYVLPLLVGDRLVGRADLKCRPRRAASSASSASRRSRASAAASTTRSSAPRRGSRARSGSSGER